jgi:hypothetical protein
MCTLASPSMNASTLRACVVLALLCFALPRAEAASFESFNLNFQGIITTVEVVRTGIPSGVPSAPPPPPQVSVGDFATATLTFTREFPTSSWIASISMESGLWSAGGSTGTIFVSDGTSGGTDRLTVGTDIAARWFASISLADVTGMAYSAGAPLQTLNGTVWTGGTFGSLQQLDPSPAPAFANRVVATIITLPVPDAGSTALMLGLSLVGLVIHRRRESPKPRALRGV